MVKSITLSSIIYSEIRKRKFNGVLLASEALFTNINNLDKSSQGLYSKENKSIANGTTRLNIAKWDGFHWMPVNKMQDDSSEHHTYLTVSKN